MDPSDRVGVVTRMRASKLAIGGLLALGALAACRGRGSDAPAEEHTTRSRIRFVNPWFELPDGRTEQVVVRIDGRGIGDCWRKDRDTERVCTETFVEPGPHVVRLVINYRDSQTLRISASKYYSSDNRIDVGVGEDIAFDLSGIEDREGDELLSRRSVNRTSNACLKRLDQLAAAPTCTTGDLDEMERRLGRARSACRGVPGRYEMQAQTLVYTVESNVRGLPMERCFVGNELRKLPGMIAEDRAGGWPRGTLETGSWWWARDPRPPSEEEWSGDGRGSDLSVAQRLGQLDEQLPEIQRRLAMVEDLMDGYFAKARPAAAIDRALEDEFSLDPTTLAGHRLWHLTSRYWDEAYDPRLAAWLADQAKRDTSKNCSVGDEAQQLVSYWTAGRHPHRAGVVGGPGHGEPHPGR